MSNNILNDISKVYFEQVSESAVPGKPAEKLGAVTAIPKSDQEAARQRTLAKDAAIRKKKGIEEATKAKPDYLDFDGDGNTKESMKKSLRDKAKQKVEEAKKPNDGNLANNYPPYDKVTRGDIIAGRLGKDQMGGKKKVTKEGYSNWRQDLAEVITKDQNQTPIKEKKVENKIIINPPMKIGEAISNLGGELIEMVEIEEKTLTSAETKKKEEIVKSMKKNLAGFRARYGDRAKEVMYATATKQAKKVAEQASEIAPKEQPAATKPNPAEVARQKQLVQIQKKQTMDRLAQLNKGVPFTSESAEIFSEEDYDRIKDRRQEFGGMGANVNQKPAKTGGNTKPYDPKKHAEANRKAMELVRQSITAKHGKGSLM